MTEILNTPDDLQARALFAEDKYAAAEPLFRKLIEAHPDDAVAYYNLGVTLAKLDRPEQAMGCYRAAIERNPSFADAYTNFGYCLNELNLLSQARQAFAIAHQIDPEEAAPILNGGIAALALGDYVAGWEGFAARWQLPAYAKFKRDFDKPFWSGQPLAGKTLFLYAEQGFGDSIQMARFVPLLAAQGANIIIEAPPALTALLQTLADSPQIITNGDDVPDFDYYCAMMDIPHALGLTLDAVPTDTPYLFADHAAIAQYQDLIPPMGARRVGLSWAGRSNHENDRKRSLTFTQISTLFTRGDSEWVSLQRVVPQQDIAVLETSGIPDWGGGFSDFSATAAAIMALDLVITVDTAIAHLAGALGKPVWVLLPFHADWRWLTDRTDSPWYPTARLFRQSKRGDWVNVLDQVADALA
jgi:tetratricopeptide (TPR) repeat protein